MAGPPEMSDEDLVTVWAQVVAAMSRTRQRIQDGLDEPELPEQWFGVLHSLLRADEHRMPMTRLARDLHMTPGGVTKLADRMGRDGLIDRRNSMGDRRVVYASLTPSGLDIAERVRHRYEAALREVVLDVLTVERLRDLAAIMSVLADAHPVIETEHDGRPAPDGEDEAEHQAVHQGHLGGSSDSHHGLVRTERDPALPERRGRGRPSDRPGS